MPAPGSYYLEGSFLLAETDEAYDADGQRTSFRRLSGVDRPTTWRDGAFAVYGEVGLGGAFALEGDALFKRVHVDEPATRFATAGPADLELALKRGWRAGGWALAASAGVHVPLGYDVEEYPALGAGDTGVFAMAHAGRGFTRGWAQAEAGLRSRGDGYRNEWPFAAQGGWAITPRWSAIGDLRGHGLLGAKSRTAVDVAGVFDPSRASSSIVEAGPGVAFLATRTLRLSAQAWHSLAGRNVPYGWKWKLALAVTR